MLLIGVGAGRMMMELSSKGFQQVICLAYPVFHPKLSPLTTIHFSPPLPLRVNPSGIVRLILMV